jgi:hypothetical protein
VKVLGHRQTQGAATDNPNVLPPRHIPTLPMRSAAWVKASRCWPMAILTLMVLTLIVSTFVGWR